MSAAAVESHADDAPAPRTPIYPVVAARADDAQLAEAEAFLEVVSRSPNDTKCARYLSLLLADAQWHRTIIAAQL